MSNPTKNATPNYWVPVGLFGLVAVVAGMMLPSLMPPETPPSPPIAQSTSAKDAKANDLRYSPPAWPETPSYTGMFIRLGLGTILVLALSVSTLIYGKRWLAAVSIKPGSGEMKLVESLHLGNRCYLHLVQMQSRQVLIGADAAGLKSIVPLTENFDQVLATTTPDEPMVESHRLAVPELPRNRAV